MSQTLASIQSQTKALTNKPAAKVPTTMGLTQSAEESVAARVKYEVEVALRPVLEQMRRGAVGSGHLEGAPSDVALGVTADLREAAQALARYEARAEKLARALSLGGFARIALALLPAVVVAVLLSLAAFPIFELLGIAPISEWVWGSFEATDSHWVKGGIVAGVVVAAGVISFGIYKGGEWLLAVYQGWR